MFEKLLEELRRNVAPPSRITAIEHPPPQPKKKRQNVNNMTVTDVNGYSMYFKSHNFDYPAITKVSRSEDDDLTIIEFEDRTKNLTIEVDTDGHEAIVKRVQAEVDKAIKEGIVKPWPENSQASKESSPRRALKVQTE